MHTLQDERKEQLYTHTHTHWQEAAAVCRCGGKRKRRPVFPQKSPISPAKEAYI